jgi:DNA-binding NarL/FixJ family response regulator
MVMHSLKNSRIVSIRRKFPLNLNRQEREIVSLVVHGLNNREIAGIMNITTQTVRQTLKVIYSKLDVTDRLDLVLFLLGNPTQIGFNKDTVRPEREEELKLSGVK